MLTTPHEPIPHRRRIGRAHAWLLPALWVLLATSAAQAQSAASRAAYNDRIGRAVTAFEAHDLATARALFEQAHAIAPSARTLRGLGLTSFEQNRYTLAMHELEASLVETKRALDDAQRDEVLEHLRWMRSKLGTLQLALTPSEAHAKVDGEAFTTTRIVLDPGLHEVQVEADGYLPEQRRLTLDAGQTSVVNVTLGPTARATASTLLEPSEPRRSSEPPVPSTDSPHLVKRWWFWTGVGVVAAASTVLAVMLRRRDDSGYESGLDGVHQVLIERVE